jgi:hypothetical protein
MKNLFTICIAIILMLIPSCKKDTTNSKVIKSLKIDAESHAFINGDGKRYFENTFTSQQESHRYELEMVKGVEYRISASQLNMLINQTRLTLVNISGDTLAESSSEVVSKSVIVMKSPATANFYLIVNLIRRSEPQFDYRLSFEEVIDDAVTFSGLEWQSNGPWIMSDSNTAGLTYSDSRIYRHLKLNSSLTGSPNMSFVIQSSSDNATNFGFVLDPADDFIQFSEYAWELPKTGYAFLALKDNGQYTIIKLNTGSMSLDWDSLGNINLDFSAGIKVDLKFESNQYNIYLNGTLLKNINGSLQNIDIVFQDCGDGITQIKDFKLGN